MTTAYNNITGARLNRANPTHLYVQFTPSTPEEVLALSELDINFYDYPLEYEVIEMGDYYQDPKVRDDKFPPLYAVVTPDFSFPKVSYNIVERLILPPYKSYLTAEAFRITGNEYRRPGNDSNQENPEDFEDCAPGCASFPCCLMTGIACDDDGIDPINCPFYEENCFNTSSNINEYLACINDYFNNLPPPPSTLNACGCEVPSNNRVPSGCIRVEDTNLGMEGVRRVKVILKDTWFTEDDVWTDDNGCFKVKGEKYSGVAWMWVKFKDKNKKRGRIRGHANNWKKLWQWAFPVKDYVGKLSGPIFNNISVDYVRTGIAENSSAHLYWGAATVTNALHEFYDNAIIDGINTPKDKLDIFVSTNSNQGFALMGAQYTITAEAKLALKSIPYVGIVFDQLTSALGGWWATLAWLPEVLIGLNGEVFEDSDVLKALVFHELAHASHYENVNIWWWTTFANRTILNGAFGDDGPWGNGTEANAGYVQVAESWAEHISFTYTHRTYGAANSTNVDWITDLENTWNNTPDHVPMGLYHDLLDASNGMETVANDNFPNAIGMVDDQVTGFTNSQMFSILTPQTKSPQNFIDRLIDEHLSSTANTEAQVNNLFNSY